MKVCFNDSHRCNKNWRYKIKLKYEEINQINQFTKINQFDLIKAESRLKINFIAQ